MPESRIDPAVVVSKASVESRDPYDIIDSNIRFLNALLREHFRHDELAPDALLSYHVDNYRAQVSNGGFSQFVYNSGWEAETVRCVREGLRAMGAGRHLELFERCAEILDRLGPDRMDEFFESEYFDENEERDDLDAFDAEFFELSEEEDLTELHSEWLRGLPNLVVLTAEEMKAEVERRAAALPDREARAEAARADEPRFLKLIRALCDEAGQSLSTITVGDPTHSFDGRRTFAWHFITDRGHHYMVDVDGTATMFDGTTREPVVAIEATDEYGAE